ncbi:rod shape-determining protein MreC [Paractinoplanes maris]|uniref:rod shape-determining protein MreC n=1 Tax=Paractinoplanes maris TaxID=1734446 RepID=UPI0020210462|nr:rod shape-determining protein MreC [Actinoplanes maris]
MRDGLIKLAEPVGPAEGYELRILRRARRLRARRRIAGAAGAAICLAILVSVFRLVAVGPAPHLVAVPPDGALLGWSAAGDVNADLVREATEVWDRTGSAGPHTAIRPLVAAHDRLLASVVVLQGYDEHKAARLAFFTSDTTAANALRLRADRPMPDPTTTQVVSLVSPRLTGPAGVAGDAFWDTYAIAVAMPGVTALEMSTTTVDEELKQDPVTANGRFVVRALPSATAETTTVTGFIKSSKVLAQWKRVFAVPGDGGAAGDAQGVRGAVVSRSGQQIVVALREDGAVRPGQLAVVAEGLVGRVTTIDRARREATIGLITGAAFAGQAYTNISNVPGSVRGTGEKLLMEHIPAGEKMDVYEGNRVLVADPSQQGDQIGAITIGRAAVTKPADTDTVELIPTANLTDLREVSIMTPFKSAAR